MCNERSDAVMTVLETNTILTIIAGLSILVLIWGVMVEVPRIMPRWWCDKMDLHQPPIDSEIVKDPTLYHIGVCPKCGVEVYQSIIHGHWHKIN